MPTVSQHFCCCVTVATSHEQQAQGCRPGVVANSAPPSQGVGLLPATSRKCYTRLLPRVVATATDEEACLGVKISEDGEAGQRTQSGPVAVEQLHISISISVVTTRYHYKGV